VAVARRVATREGMDAGSVVTRECRRVVYIYKAKKEVKGSKFRSIWGKVCRPHGNNGLVRCRFRKNLPPSSIAGPCRIMLYPSRV